MANWTIRGATPGDWPEIAALLTASDLPLAGAADYLDRFLVAVQGETLLGCAAVEQYGQDGLLRSVAVAGSARGSGLGQALVQAALEQARVDGLCRITLLTTTAATFFPRFGFHSIDRDAAPQAVQASIEFRDACPASATVMHLDLAPTGRSRHVSPV